MNLNYSKKQIAVLSLILFALIGLLKISPVMIYVVAALLVYTLVVNKMEYVFGVLVLLFALSVMNTTLVEKGFHFYLVTRGSIFLLAGVVTLKSGATKSAWFLSPFYWLLAYVLYIMITSLQGWAPMISELKAILFFVFIVAFVQIISAVNLKQVDVKFVRSVMLTLASFYILGSVAVIPFPAIGQSMIMLVRDWSVEEFDVVSLGSVSLFNGLTWHSQTLGPLIAVLNAFLLSDYLCAIRKKDWLYRVLLLSCPLLVYKTSSRTALFAYLVSVLASLFFFGKEKNVSEGKRMNVVVSFIGLFLVAALVLVASSTARLNIESFLRKSADTKDIDRSESLGESLTSSRMGLVEEGMANFKESPLFGNGFQVSKEMQGVERSNIAMLLSAPVEKGFLPVMVLEEGGIVGAMLFSVFIVLLFVKYSKLRLNSFLATFSTFIALNSGEATFFSTSGAGGILWSICFCSLILDVDRHRRWLATRQLQRVEAVASGNVWG